MEYFSHAPEEIQAGMLLQQFERRIDAEHIVPELEVLLEEKYIPPLGIPKDVAQSFPASPQLQEILSYGLLDPHFQITSQEQKQTEGKAIADTAGSILIGRMMDNIFQKKFDKTKPHCSLKNVYENLQTLSMPHSINQEVTEAYLHNVQLVLLDYFRHMLVSNLHATLEEIEQLPPENPLKILYRNIPIASGFKNTFDFLVRGIVSETNNLYALFEIITKRAKEDVPIISNQEGPVTRDQTLNIFHASRSAVLRGLAKNDKDLFAELINEGIPENPQVGDGILTRGQRRNTKQHTLVSFVYKPEAFRIIPSEKPDTLGVVVLHDVRGHLLQADEKAYLNQREHPEQIRKEPRIVFGCPARAPRAYGKPNAIKYIHVLAVDVLQKLNEQYLK